VELATRWDYANEEHRNGIDETCRIDRSAHTPFGASKAAADLLVQEYGRHFGLATVCFRASCLTGARHAGAEQHGFLAYLARAIGQGRTYRIFGYGGKQVRDNLHSLDVCAAVMAFAERPAVGAVYNLGGGRGNSVSVLEAIERLEELTGQSLQTEYVEEARRADHVCYISDLSRFHAAYPGWEVTMSLDAIFAELASLMRAAH
jgi:CDP-paratose 2-epimerase